MDTPVSESICRAMGSVKGLTKPVIRSAREAASLEGGARLGVLASCMISLGDNLLLSNFPSKMDFTVPWYCCGAGGEESPCQPRCAASRTQSASHSGCPSA